MCRTGSPDGQIYKDRAKQVERNMVAEEHQQEQRQVADPQYENANQQQVQKRESLYERFMQHLKPLPATPVAGGPPPAEEKVGRKERRRRIKEYGKLKKELKENPRFVTEEEVRNLPRFQTKQGRDQWANKTLSHSKLTRGETMRMILDYGDYSNFENLDLVMRNLVATQALKKFRDEFFIVQRSSVEEIVNAIKNSENGVSRLLDPALRLGLSLAQKDPTTDRWEKQKYRELDEAMTTAVMEATLTHQANESAVREYFRKKGSKDPQGDADKAIRANKAQQIQIAKRLLLMQLSDFQMITTDKNKNATSTPWNKSMAVALSHCSRVVLTLPKQDAGNSNVLHQQNMWRAIYTVNGSNTAEDNSRASSTHSIERRKAFEVGTTGSKEKKVWFNLTGQRGMNCAIGGLGNGGVSGKTIANDGSCGHFYSMYKEADATHYGTMLMGLESDANGVTNQMGHTHDWHATPEKASSLGGQRTDEVGDKYGGRQCLLNEMSAMDITTWMLALEHKMLEWQANGGMGQTEARDVMSMLAGKKLDAQQWTRLRGILGVDDNVGIGARP